MAMTNQMTAYFSRSRCRRIISKRVARMMTDPIRPRALAPVIGRPPPGRRTPTDSPGRSLGEAGRPAPDDRHAQRHDGAEEVDRGAQRGRRGAAGGARPHVDGHLGDGAAHPGGDDEGLDGVAEVLRGVVGGEHAHRPPVGRAEARRDVGEAGAGQPAEHPGQQDHRPPARAAHLVGVAVAGEARPDAPRRPRPAGRGAPGGSAGRAGRRRRSAPRRRSRCAARSGSPSASRRRRRG